jgi:hypothetical protein
VLVGLPPAALTVDLRWLLRLLGNVIYCCFDIPMNFRHNYDWNATKIMSKCCQNIHVSLLMMKCKWNIAEWYLNFMGMDIHGYPSIHRIWIWGDIHAHGYFRGRGRARQLDLGMDLVFLYPSKPAPLPSLVWIRELGRPYNASSCVWSSILSNWSQIMPSQKKGTSTTGIGERLLYMIILGWCCIWKNCTLMAVFTT